MSKNKGRPASSGAASKKGTRNPDRRGGKAWKKSKGEPASRNNGKTIAGYSPKKLTEGQLAEKVAEARTRVDRRRSARAVRRSEVARSAFFAGRTDVALIDA